MPNLDKYPITGMAFVESSDVHMSQYRDCQRKLREFAIVSDLPSSAHALLEKNVIPDIAYLERIVGLMGMQWSQANIGERSPAFWYAKHPSVEEAVYVVGLDVALHGNVELPALLASDERKEYKKAGPYRNADALTLFENTLEYFNTPDSLSAYAHLDRLYDRARELGEAMAVHAGGRLTPLSDAEDVFGTMVKGHFFGAPWFTSKWHNANEPTVMETALLDWLDRVLTDRGGASDALSLDSVVFSRVVPSGRGVRSDQNLIKRRRTFAVTKYEAAIVKAFSYQLLRKWKSMEGSFCFYSNWAGKASQYMRDCVSDSQHVFSADWSSFDQHVKATARSVVLECLKSAFDPDWHFLLEEIFYGMNSRSLITPYGRVTPKSPMGLESGAGFTGIIGSIWNKICCQEIFHNLGVKTKYTFHYGDDTVIMYDGDAIDVREFASQAKLLGMECNPDKQEHTSFPQRKATFLQKRFIDTPEGVSNGVHPLMRMLPRILWKDTTANDELMVMEVAKSQATEDGKLVLDVYAQLEELRYHPNFKEFVTFVCLNHPQYLDPRLIVDFEKVARREENADADPWVGIETFESVQHVVSLFDKVFPPDWRFRDRTYSVNELNWHASRTMDEEHRGGYLKGWLWTDEQRRGYMRWERVGMTKKQKQQATAFGQRKGTRSFEDEVVQYQKSVGVKLTSTQVDNLRTGKKLTWTSDQRALMTEYGRLGSDDEKRKWRKDFDLYSTIYVRSEEKSISMPPFEHYLTLAYAEFGTPDPSYDEAMQGVSPAWVQSIARDFGTLRVPHEGLPENMLSKYIDAF